MAFLINTMNKTIGVTYGSGARYESFVSAAITREQKNHFFDKYLGLRGVKKKRILKKNVLSCLIAIMKVSLTNNGWPRSFYCKRMT